MKINKKFLSIVVIVLIFAALVGAYLFYTNSNQKFKLSANTNMSKTLSMGLVELNVKNLKIVQEFYEKKIGLKVIEIKENYTLLGRNDIPLIALYEDKNLKIAPITEAGLYHIALVFDSRQHLAETLNRMFTQAPDLYQGSADHIATEAFYFADPEGNGVELYFDKPLSNWKYDASGKPLMSSEYIDAKEYLNKYFTTSTTLNNISMGHVHLKIGNIALAKKFYIENLLFDEMNSSNGALFVSRDNYHHHLGMNTWESSGASSRSEGYTGLRSFEINYFNSEVFITIKTKLKQSEYKFEEVSSNEIAVFDPWNNKVRLLNK